MCIRHTYACRLPTQHSLIEEVLLGFGPHSLKALLLATTKHTRLIGRTLHSRTGRGGDDSRLASVAHGLCAREAAALTK